MQLSKVNDFDPNKKGAHIVSNGRQTNVSGTNSASARPRDFELVQSEQSIDLVVTIGRQSKIKMAISTARVRELDFEFDYNVLFK